MKIEQSYRIFFLPMFAVGMFAVFLLGSGMNLFSSGNGSIVNNFVFAQQNQTSNAEYNITAATTYNEMLNPRQVEYPAHLGFNDLHIEAIRHIDPNATQNVSEDLFNLIVHHHCKVYDDMTAACLLFPTGMGDQDKPYGIEYVIPATMYDQLPEGEKKYWHYHLTELPNVKATTPDMTQEEYAAVKSVLDDTYGKVVYFWQYGDEFPIGEPTAVIIEDIVKQANNTNVE